MYLNRFSRAVFNVNGGFSVTIAVYANAANNYVDVNLDNNMITIDFRLATVSDVNVSM